MMNSMLAKLEYIKDQCEDPEKKKKKERRGKELG